MIGTLALFLPHDAALNRLLFNLGLCGRWFWLIDGVLAGRNVALGGKWGKLAIAVGAWHTVVQFWWCFNHWHEGRDLCSRKTLLLEVGYLTGSPDRLLKLLRLFFPFLLFILGCLVALGTSCFFGLTDRFWLRPLVA